MTRTMRATQLAVGLAATIGLLATSAASVGAVGSGPPPRTLVDDGNFSVVTGSPVNVNGHYVPIVGRFDAGSYDDIIWYAAGSTPEQYWAGSSTLAAPFTKSVLHQQVTGSYVPIAGNFGGDSHTDILWYGPGSQPDVLWISNGDGTFTSHPVSIAGVYDDTVVHNALPAHDAILWTIPDDGGTGSLWQFTATGAHHTFPETVTGHPQVLSGDFDDNGLGDLFLYNPGAGADALWRRTSNANGTFTKTTETVNGSYTPIVGQFSPGGGGSDILWDAPSGGTRPLWEGQTNGTFTGSSHLLPPGHGTVIHASYDSVVFWGGGSPDHLWIDGGASADFLHPTGAPDVDGSAMPVDGFFNYTYLGSVLWYRPGSGAEMEFIYNP